MALSVHDLRDMAHAHDKATIGGLSGLRQAPLARRLGRLLLRCAFILIATLSLALLMWAIATSAMHRPKATGQDPNTRVQGEVPVEASGPPQPKSTLDRFNASVASWTSGLLGNFRSSAPREVFGERRELSGGVDLSKFAPKSAPLPASGTQERIDASSLFASGKERAPAAPLAEARRSHALAIQSAPTPGAFREIRTGLTAPQATALAAQPAVQPSRESTLRSQAASRTAPAAPPARESLPSAIPHTARETGPAFAAPANGTGKTAQRQTLAEETATTAIRAAQADFRKFEQARQAINTLLAQESDVRVRSLFEEHMASLVDVRRSAMSERSGADPLKDKFQPAGIQEGVSATIAACLQKVDHLESAAVARKTVNVQPLLPAFVFVASAPGLPKGRGPAHDALSEQVNACIGSLHALGTATLSIAAPAAGTDQLLEKLSRTEGALVWQKP